MADKTKIEWTDATWNVITGCNVISPGCKNCYAMKLAGGRLRNHPTRQGLTQDGKNGPVWNGRVRWNGQMEDQPLRWRRPRRVFVCAHADLFYGGVPRGWIDRVFAIMAMAPQHTFQVLTKRPARMQAYLTSPETHKRVAFQMSEIAKGRPNTEAPPLAFPLRNVWLGTSAENQRTAEDRIPPLLATPAAVRWVSAEPLLGHIDFPPLSMLDWVVVGGESGPRSRPMHPDWARALRDQTVAAGKYFHFKQWGRWAPWDDENWSAPAGTDDLDLRESVHFLNGVDMVPVGKRAAGRTLDGRTWDEEPGGDR